MHIPDGFLDPRICAGAGAVSAAALGASLRRVRPEAEAGLASRMGVTAAYVFAAQMVNFPVAAGISGHLLGGLLAAVLLGPYAASVVMAAVFVIQAFFFLDGGYTALGANFLNMGLAGTWGGYALYAALAGAAPTPRRSLRAAGAAAWLSVMLGAALTAGELALSAAVSGRLVFPAMLAVHALIGLGEAAITVAALGLLWRVRPDLITGHPSPRSSRGWSAAAAAGFLGVALLAPLASRAPDGLEHVAAALGFSAKAAAASLPAPMPDYSLPGFESAGWVPVAASLAGAALVSLALLGALRLPQSLTLRLSASPTPPLSHSPKGPDPRVQLALVLAVVLTAVLVPPARAGKLWPLAGLALAWALFSRLSVSRLLPRAAVMLPLVSLAALSAASHRAGSQDAWLGLAFLRASVCFLVTAAFLHATPEPEVLRALAAFRLPRALSQTVAFAIRYLRVIGEEAARMLQARASRSPGGGTLALRAGVTGGIIGSLFIRSYERSERISGAMAARGFSPEASGAHAHGSRAPLTRLDWTLALGAALLLAGVWLWP